MRYHLRSRRLGYAAPAGRGGGGSRKAATSRPAGVGAGEALVLGVILADVDGAITEGTESFLGLTGVASGSLPVSWDAVTVGGAAVPDAAWLEARLGPAGVAAWETELASAHGGRTPVLVVAARAGRADGRYVGFVLERPWPPRPHVWNEAWCRALTTCPATLCFTLTARGEIVAVNAAGAERLGYRECDLLGRAVADVVHPHDRPRLRAMVVDRGEDRGAEPRELRCLCHDGSVVWTRGLARALPGGPGRVLFLLAGRGGGTAEDEDAQERLLAYQMRLRTLTLESALAEERQRRRIALGLHDDVGHSLALARMKIAECLQRAAAPWPELGEARTLIEEAIGSTRALTFDLSPPTLYELGLEPAVESLGERLAAASQVRFRFATDGRVKALSPEATVLLYRSVAELLRNVVKHAGARAMAVEVARVHDRIEIAVCDDGIGFDPAAAAERRGRERGYGLFSIREQMRAIGGHLDVETAPGRGTRCSLRAPLESAGV